MHAEGQLSKWFQFRLHLIWGANEPWKGQMGVALQGKSLPRPDFFWFYFIYLFILTHFAETFACINMQAPRPPSPPPSPQYLALMAEHLNSISGTTSRFKVDLSRGTSIHSHSVNGMSRNDQITGLTISSDTVWLNVYTLRPKHIL